ncbi:MAG: hypothetical protein ABFC92_03425 [Rectinema sp.]
MNDEFSEGYQPEDYNKPVELQERDYRVQIIAVKSTYTQNTGLPMLEIDLKINEAPITFRHRIVKNEYFNGNMTKFFDCFGIHRGDFDYNHWNKKVGLAHIHKGKPNDQGKAYYEIQYLVVGTPIIGGHSSSIPPARQSVSQPLAPPPINGREEEPMPFNDDIPF